MYLDKENIEWIIFNANKKFLVGQLKHEFNTRGAGKEILDKYKVFDRLQWPIGLSVVFKILFRHLANNFFIIKNVN